MKLLLRFAKKYTWALIITVIASLALVGAQLLIPWLVRNLISLVTDQSLTDETMQTVTRLTLIALIAYVGRGFMQFLRSYMAHIAGLGAVYRMLADSYMNTCRNFHSVSMRTSKPAN